VSAVFELCERWIARYAELDPYAATSWGFRELEDRLPDYSPEGVAARAEHRRAGLAELAGLAETPIESPHDRLAAGVMRDILEIEEALDEAGEWLRPLYVFGSPVQHLRQAFDLMTLEGEDDWRRAAARMNELPRAVDQLISTLEEGIRRRVMAAPRQALACAEMAANWAGLRGDPPYFPRLAHGYGSDGSLREELDAAAARASEACERLATFLADEYAARSTEPDPVGRDRYLLHARANLGADIDPEETYAWGWDELTRIEAEMASAGKRIVPDGTLEDVFRLLDTDPSRAIEGPERLREWLQDLMDRTIEELDGRHFDIPEPVRTVEAMLSPPGTAAAMYYTPPSDDFSRPGRTWYPVRDLTRFPMWAEVSTCYHEGVPGHHLQAAQVVFRRDRLSSFQRLYSWIPGHGEGWALYAERLMAELGYLENPDHLLGMLESQRFRAARVIVDIGMHLELEIPGGQPFHPGERWTGGLGLEFVRAHTRLDGGFVSSEIDRYLGLPGQAISYKVGEREWLAVREDVRAREGDAFDLKAFHSRALDLGPVGLDRLRRELTLR
jgi:uncharacterized protein (DUF885 family)